MKTKQKNAARSLATIVGEIRKTLRNDVGNIIKRGDLLLEAKEQLEHGQWLPWLEDNFSMDERTAQRAMAVAKFAAKYDSLSDLHLTKSALYDLSSGDYPEKVIKEPEPEEDLPETDELRRRLQEEIDAEAEAILDGPPPDLPPSTEPPAPTDFTLVQFDKAIKNLAELHTKSVSKFVGTAHTGGDLRKIADFLCAVADALKSETGRGKTLRRIGTDSWAVEEGMTA